jgi:hypothetical protein
MKITRHGRRARIPLIKEQNMNEIIAVFMGGFSLIAVFCLGQFVQVFTSMKRKTEGMANLIIPRRAELYREFLCAIIQMLHDQGDMPKAEKGKQGMEGVRHA